MKGSRELLEDRLERYEESLGGLSSYLKELKTMTAKHGTDREHFEEDLIETEHNVRFYEGEIARIKKELSGLPKPGPTRPGVGTTLPQIPKPGINALIFSAIGFIAGAVLGSGLKSRKGSEDSHE